MALDNLALKKIVDKMQENLVGAFLEKPYALSLKHFAFPYHSSKDKTNSGRGVLILCLDSNNPFISYSFDKYTKIQLNTPFFNSLKKLTGTQIESIKKVEGERIVNIHTKVVNELLDTINTSYDLTIELFPQQPNCYLIPLPYNKVTSIFKEHNDIMSKRYIARGLSYILPEKRLPLDQTCQNLEQIKSYLSFSTYRLFEKYSQGKDFKTCLINLLNSKDLYLINNNIEPYHFSREDAKIIQIENIYSSYIQNQASLAKKLNNIDLINQVNKAIELNKKKQKHILQDIEKAKTRLVYKDYGQTLFLHQLEIKPNSKECNFDNFHISLDPKLNVIENANKYFKLYRKAKSAIEILTPLVDKTKLEIEYLQEKLLQIDKGNNQDILELKHELTLEGYLKNNLNGKKIKKMGKASFKPHYLIGDNYKIGFGMNALQNEELTFNIARKDNLFLHVSNYPGSHVVILEGDNNSTRLLASELCLYLSNLTSGDVIYTYKSDVKKSKDKKGMVNLLSYKTFTIPKIRETSIKLFDEILKNH